MAKSRRSKVLEVTQDQVARSEVAIRFHVTEVVRDVGQRQDFFADVVGNFLVADGLLESLRGHGP